MSTSSGSKPAQPLTDTDRQRMLDILRTNQGFSEPERWVEYAWEHKFKSVQAEKILECPECAARKNEILGQYVYYSTLSQLRRCGNCGLVFSDSRIDPAEVRAHFEESYKEENYFRVWRRRIVEQIAHLVDRLSPPGGRVLDIGGATGYQMEVVRKRRPDLDITISDLSASSCETASKQGFRTICGSMTALNSIQERFNVVVMCDVIYYEQDLAGIWSMLPNVIADGGSLVIRAPDTLAIMRLTQLVSRLIKSQEALELSDRIPFFTPDHFYAFSRRFLTDRLRKIGFDQVTSLPSELLSPDWKSRCLNAIMYYPAMIIHRLTFGQMLLTPSVLYVASRLRPKSAIRESGP